MNVYIIFESYENESNIEYTLYNNRSIPKSVSWKLSRVFNSYDDCLNCAKNKKINNLQIIANISIVNMMNGIFDQCNIRSGSHGYRTGINIGIQSDIKIPPPCKLDDILTIISRNEIINLA